jgi:hypothetical protein
MTASSTSSAATVGRSRARPAITVAVLAALLASSAVNGGGIRALPWRTSTRGVPAATPTWSRDGGEGSRQLRLKCTYSRALPGVLERTGTGPAPPGHHWDIMTCPGSVPGPPGGILVPVLPGVVQARQHMPTPARRAMTPAAAAMGERFRDTAEIRLRGTYDQAVRGLAARHSLIHTRLTSLGAPPQLTSPVPGAEHPVGGDPRSAARACRCVDMSATSLIRLIDVRVRVRSCGPHPDSQAPPCQDRVPMRSRSAQLVGRQQPFLFQPGRLAG